MTEPLALEPGELRRFGHRVVDAIADHLEGLRDRPPIVKATRAELEARLREPPPARGVGADAALDRLLADVLPYGQQGQHPRFFARIPGPSNGVSALADALGAGFNLFVGSWTGGSGPATLELVVLDWLRELLGLPPGTEGLMVSGGSVAALTALCAARTARGGDVAYLSDQAHASNARALRILGVEHVRVLPTGERFALRLDALRAALAADRAAGLRPLCVIATAGSTNTGAVDPLEDLADLCAGEGLWLHADAAYGGAAALVPEGRALLAGLERADSVALDPHKWLFQPYEIGCVLVREPGALERAFAIDPEYLADVRGGEVNLFDRGPQLTRGSRALKLWLSLQTFGLDAFRAAIARGIALAAHAEVLLRARPGWEVVTPAQLGIVSFRRTGADQAALVEALVADGYAAISSTVLRGRPALRLCTINPRTTEEEVEATIERLEALASLRAR